MYQKVIIVGHLGRDPELRYTPAGSPVCNFSVACNRRFKSATDGERSEETTWFKVTVWGSRAEACNEFLSKGRLVLVEGTLQPDKATGGPKAFTRNDGTCGAAFEVRADMVRFLAGGRREEEAEAGQGELPF